MIFYEDDIVTGTTPRGDFFRGILSSIPYTKETLESEGVDELTFEVSYYVPSKEQNERINEIHYMDDLYIDDFFGSELTLDTSIFFDEPFKEGDKIVIQDNPMFFREKEDTPSHFFGAEQTISAVNNVPFENRYYRRPYYRVVDSPATVSEFDIDIEKTIAIRKQKYTGVLKDIQLPKL